jgi:NADPH-dependent 2,4-dienoyl-CoA reductase/sulfur reductase-like enzyme
VSGAGTLTPALSREREREEDALLALPPAGEGRGEGIFVIVGSGPAGMRAAERLVQAGKRPIVIDEAERHGGQIYRQPPASMQRVRRDLYGFEAGRAAAVLDGFEALRPHVDYRPQTLVWQVEANALQLLHAGRTTTQPFDALILATGATDRVLPFSGWTLPGVYTLGAAQVALKFQAALIGPRVVFAGTGPLLYLVAWQYASHGGKVAAVLDSAPLSAKLRAAPGMLARPAVAAKGAYFLARLRLLGVPLHGGVTLLQAEGRERVTGLSWLAQGETHTTGCEAIGFGHGLRSETQLADLAGCVFDWNETDQAWLPRRDAEGRSSAPGVYLAGDGAAILGADAAALSGATAAQAPLEDFSLSRSRERAGVRVEAHNSPSPQPSPASGRGSEMRSHLAFRRALETAFPLPATWAAEAPDSLIVCRCEEITAGTLRACVRETGARELNRLKALTRIGMGRCQGRMCAPGAARLLAEATGCRLEDVGRLRGQAPVKPLPVALLHEAAPSTVVPEDEDD